jgi:hypothetical protein
LKGWKNILPSTFNEILCLTLVYLTFLLWLLQSVKAIELPEAVLGATIVTWTLMVQYYFRKKPPKDSTEAQNIEVEKKG